MQLQLSVDPPSLSEDAYGVIKFTRKRVGKTKTIKSHGILMRAEWDIHEHLAQGQLVQLLPQCHTPDADIYAVYPAQHKSAARVRAFVDFVAEAFRPAKP